MASRFALVLVVAGLAGFACKKNGEADSDPAPATADDSEAAPAGAEPVADTVDPDFDLDVPLPPDEASRPPIPISESGASLFDAESEADSPVLWTIQGAAIVFSTAEVGRSDAAVDLQIAMESGGGRQLVTTCRGLDVAEGSGRATAFVRGDEALIACTTGSGSAQRSWGVRMALDEASGLVRQIGRFENRGPPRLDRGDAGAPEAP